MRRPLYPLAAVVGQAQIKRALLLAAVSPSIGGVLIRGEKGTAKSTAARGLSELLGPAGGRPAPFLTLPLSATEDRVAGGLDLAEALAKGRRKASPGLLAQADGGVLYVDEVNLLGDHLADLVLDAAASGRLRLERDGLSEAFEARFVLVGTMNPEEGELRPQLLDRFGLSAIAAAETDPADRVELMLRREAFEASPEDFRRLWAPATESLRRRLAAARGLLPEVSASPEVRALAARLAMEARAAGHRADLVIERAAAALAAWEGRREIALEDVEAAAPLALAHRRREAAPPPPPPPAPEPAKADEAGQKEAPEGEASPEEAAAQEGAPQEGAPQEAAPQEGASQEAALQEDGPEKPPPEATEEGRGAEPAEDKVFEAGPLFTAPPIQSPRDRLRRRGSGRRSRSRTSRRLGRRIKSGPWRGGRDLDLGATILAAAPRQAGRKRPEGLVVAVAPSDFREAVRERRLGNHLFFTVDASGSMGARGRMAASKGAVMSLLLDAYQKRDQVALIVFRRDKAQVALPPTPSVDLAGKLLSELPVGGRTPLSSALALTFREVSNVLAKNPLARPIVVLVTDGRGNLALEEGAKPVEEAWRLAEIMARDQRVQYIVVDTEEPGAISFGLAGILAGKLGASLRRASDLKARTLVDLVRGHGGP